MNTALISRHRRAAHRGERCDPPFWPLPNIAPANSRWHRNPALQVRPIGCLRQCFSAALRFRRNPNAFPSKCRGCARQRRVNGGANARLGARDDAACNDNLLREKLVELEPGPCGMRAIFEAKDAATSGRRLNARGRTAAAKRPRAAIASSNSGGRRIGKGAANRVRADARRASARPTAPAPAVVRIHRRERIGSRLAGIDDAERRD